MKTVLDEGYTWFLDAIGYKGGSLIVRVVEGVRTSGPEDFAVEGFVLHHPPSLEVVQDGARAAGGSQPN